MANAPVGKALVAQGGGPTAVINQSLVGVVQQAKKQKEITAIYGALHGVSGIVAENLVDLTQEADDNLENVAAVPASARARPGRDRRRRTASPPGVYRFPPVPPPGRCPAAPRPPFAAPWRAPAGAGTVARASRRRPASPNWGLGSPSYRGPVRPDRRLESSRWRISIWRISRCL